MTTPPRVLLLAERMVVGGAERHFLQKATFLKSFGCHVVVASSGGPLEEELYRRGIAHCRIRSDVARPLTLVDMHADLRQLAGIIRREGIQVINCMAGMPFVIASAIWEFTQIPVAYEVLSPYYCVQAEWSAVLRRHVEHCGCFYATSATDAANQCEVCGLEADAARIIPLSVDTTRFHPAAGREMRACLGLADDGRPVVMTASRLAPEKQASIEALLEASARLKGAHQLLVVGDGPSRPAIEARAREVGVAAVFTGQRDDMPDLYNAADIFVGMGMTAQEAAACGKPVVLTNLSQGTDRQSVGYWGDDAGTEFGNGTPYPGCRLYSIGELLAPLLADAERRAALGERGRSAILARFAAEEVNRLWYEEIARLASISAKG